MALKIRLASESEITHLQTLIEASVRGLQRRDYSEEQLEAALRTVYGVDTRLIQDGTYYVVEDGEKYAGCGGWSRRKTLYGGDQWHGRQDALLDPEREAAKIRAFFVHPEYARQGVGTMILDRCEWAAREEGFHRLEMGATLTGVPFYEAKGYVELERLEVPLEEGLTLPIVRMGKELG
jgi:GNAT superfamily N-acetyltransferase